MLKLLLLCFLSLAIAKMYVYSPDALRFEMQSRYSHGEIRNSLANFGNPPYGSVIVGRVFYRASQSDACQRMDPFDWTDDPDQINTPILLVNRGSCYFSIKARHAQDIGARALIVVDNTDENPENVIMVDSGSAGNIFIPTFLISKSDGELIQRYINNSTYTRHVALSLTFDVPHNGSKINYDLYMSSEVPHVYDFLRDFAPIASGIKKEHAIFKPHYVTSYCIWCSVNNFSKSENNCISGGRYCVEPPLGSAFSGRDYIYENLREICIYRQTEKKDTYALWFNYIKYYSDLCTGNLTDSCAEAAMKKANIDEKKVKLCMKESFLQGDPLIADNILLKSERESWANVSASFYPSLVVNNQTYRGDWEVDPVVRALCAGYSYGQDPEFCKGSSPPDKDGDNKSVGAGTIVLILTLCVVLIGVILVFYRMWMKREMKDEMRKQVNTAVSQYFALSDTSNMKQGDRPVVRVSYN